MRRLYLEYSVNHENEASVREHGALVERFLPSEGDRRRGWVGIDKRAEGNGYRHYLRFKTDEEVCLEGLEKDYVNLRDFKLREEKPTTDTLELSFPDDRREILRRLGLGGD